MAQDGSADNQYHTFIKQSNYSDKTYIKLNCQQLTIFNSKVVAICDAVISMIVSIAAMKYCNGSY